MANRKSWRRSSNPQTSQPRPAMSNSRSGNKSVTGLNFHGITDDGLTTILGFLLGKEVTINATDGAIYSGTFGGTERSSGKDEVIFMLKYARIVKNGTKKNSATLHDVRGSIAARLLVPVSRVNTIKAGKIDFNSGSPGARVTDSSASAKGFAIDGEISRGTGGAGRTLKRFEDFSEIPTYGVNNSNTGTLDEQTFGDLAAVNGNRSSKKWDQFQVNEDKFGIKTSFDEDEYTTKLDRRGEGFAEKQKEAARLASEIEKETSENVHMKEERNQDLGKNFDEEDLYSGVQRTMPKGTPDTSKSTTESNDKPRLSYADAAAGNIKNSVSQTASDRNVSQPAKVTTQPSAKKDNEHGSEKQTKPSSSRDKSNRDILPQLAKVKATPTGRKSPKRNSPLPTTPPVSSSAVRVLNLDAPTPKPEHKKRFEEYKVKREMNSLVYNREKITDDLKNFSSQFNSKNVQTHRSHSNSNASANAESGNDLKRKNSTSSTENKDKTESKETEQKKETKVVETPKSTNTKEKPSDNIEEVKEKATSEESDHVNEKKTDSAGAKTKQKTKIKSKLNPNAQEFKMNPNAPSFEPTPKAAAVSQYKNNYGYNNGGRMESSQPMQNNPQAYPGMPMQNLHMSYGQPYSVVVPGPVPAPVAGNGSGFQYVQGNPVGFHGNVPGRYAPPQTGSVPLAPYQMNPVMLAQAQQRMPTHPFPFYTSGMYPTGHTATGHMVAPQPPMYQPNTGSMGHMPNNNMNMMPRGGHNNRRGRGRARYHAQASNTHSVSSTQSQSIDKQEETDRRQDDNQR